LSEVNQRGNHPWFMQVNFPGTHPPLVVTENMAAEMQGREFPMAVDSSIDKDIQMQIRRDYGAEIENLDGWFGKMMEFLDKSEHLKDTIICVASDHGEMLGDHNMFGKQVPWQGAISVPLACMGGDIKAGSVVSRPVTVMDLAATFLDYANVKPPSGMTSRSIRPLLLNNESNNTRNYIQSGLKNFRVVIQQTNVTTFKFICCKNNCPYSQPGVSLLDQTTLNGIDPNPDPMIMDSQNNNDHPQHPISELTVANALDGYGEDLDLPSQLKVAGVPYEKLLYDVVNDPFELKDLSAQFPEVVKRMIELLPPNTCLGQKSFNPKPRMRIKSNRGGCS